MVPGRVEPGPLASILVPLGLIALAAALRLPDLATRGTWDGDQGHDMLMLRALVRDGVIPLLGPPTSIGDVHHGALYYYLLAPAAAVTGGDSPLAVVLLIALAGIAAVGVTWWLARSIAGPVAGLVAGLAMAISPASIDESTFIWNPNLIGLSSAIALAGAWHAWHARRPGWWLLAAIGTAVTMQCHVLGVTLLPIVGALFVADVRRRLADTERRVLARVGLAGLGLIALSFLPLVVHELTTNFAEVQAALDYLRSGGDPAAEGPIGRFLLIGTRVVSWPLVGLVVDGVAAAVLSLVAVVSIAVWRSALGLRRGARGRAMAGTGPALDGCWRSRSWLRAWRSSFAACPTTTTTPSRIQWCSCWSGSGAAALWRAIPTVPLARSVPRGLTPRAVCSRSWVSGRWSPGRGRTSLPAFMPMAAIPAARAAAERIEAVAGPGAIDLRSLPVFKSIEAYAYPLVVGGRELERGEDIGTAHACPRRCRITSAATSIVVICDRLFESVIGATCGGPAEDDPGAVGVGASCSTGSMGLRAG